MRRDPTRQSVRGHRRYHDRKFHRKDCSLTLAGTFGVHASSVKLDKMSNYREPESETSVKSGTCSNSLAKTIECEREKRGIDPFAAITHDDLDVRLDSLEADLNAASLWCEL